MNTLTKFLDEVEQRLGKATPPDCGDNSCYFAIKKEGMRTNGGCRCYKNCTVEARYYANRNLRTMPSDLKTLLALVKRQREGLEDINRQRGKDCWQKGCTCPFDIAYSCLADCDRIAKGDEKCS